MYENKNMKNSIFSVMDTEELFYINGGGTRTIVQSSEVSVNSPSISVTGSVTGSVDNQNKMNSNGDPMTTGSVSASGAVTWNSATTTTTSTTTVTTTVEVPDDMNTQTLQQGPSSGSSSGK